MMDMSSRVEDDDDDDDTATKKKKKKRKKAMGDEDLWGRILASVWMERKLGVGFYIREVMREKERKREEEGGAKRRRGNRGGLVG